MMTRKQLFIITIQTSTRIVGLTYSAKTSNVIPVNVTPYVFLRQEIRGLVIAKSRYIIQSNNLVLVILWFTDIGGCIFSCSKSLSSPTYAGNLPGLNQGHLLVYLFSFIYLIAVACNLTTK
jgi:hypothetical protein